MTVLFITLGPAITAYLIAAIVVAHSSEVVDDVF